MHTNNVTVRCCYHDCNQQISLCDAPKLFQNSSWHYVVKAKSMNPQHRVVKVNGKVYRVFCSRCPRPTSSVRRCEKCKNRDVLQVCLNHNYCAACNRYTFTKYAYKVCQKCSQFACDQCMVRRVCRVCINKAERAPDLISNAIEESRCLISRHSRVVQIITQYAVGYLLQCNFPGCAQTVQLDDRFSFLQTDFSLQGLDSSIHNYYFTRASPIVYFVSESYVNHKSRSKLNYVSGQYTFVCCHYAGHQTFGCSFKRCNNPVAERDAVCLNHALCHNCGARDKLTVCSCCKLRYCHNCGISTGENSRLCVSCEKQAMLVKLQRGINNVVANLFGSDVVDIIISFSVGYWLVCCNDDCKKEIHVNSQCEFENNRDMKGHYISHYSINLLRISPQRLKQTRFVFGGRRRYFCSHCAASGALRRCKYRQALKSRDPAAKCQNMEMHMSMSGGCMDHTYCDLCLSTHSASNYPWHACCRATSCGRMFCQRCYRQKLDTIIMSCVDPAGVADNEMNEELLDSAVKGRPSKYRSRSGKEQKRRSYTTRRSDTKSSYRSNKKISKP